MSEQSGTVVAFLGTGIMGAPMARNLAAAGYQVRAWNRTRARAEALVEGGVSVADSPAAAAEGAEVLITMLVDGDAVDDAVFGPSGAASTLPDGAAWAQMGTIGVTATDRLAAKADQARVGMVDAPVLGSNKPAEEGNLIVLASGPPDLRPRLQPVFDVLGRRTTWLAEVGAGSRLKMVVNSWVLALNTATAEAIALAEGLGLDPKLFLEIVAGGPTDSPYAHIKGQAIISRHFPPSFTTVNAHKDSVLVQEACRMAGVELRVADAVRQQLSRAVDLGHGEDDMAAVYYASAPADMPSDRA